MNLTLTDLLTPAQIDQAETALGNTLLELTCEENREVSRIHVLYEERRRAARREAILKALQAPEKAPAEPDLPEAQGVPASQESVSPYISVQTVEWDLMPQEAGESEPMVHSPAVELPKYEEQLPDYASEASTSPEPPDNVVTIEVPPVQTPAPKHMGVEELVKPNPYTPKVPRYTTAQLADAMGVHPTSISNWIKAGWIQPIPGSSRPQIFEVQSIKEFRKEIEARRQAGQQEAAAALQRYRAEQIDRTSPEFLTGLILGARKDFPQGFFVAYNASESTCGVFKYPAALGLPAGWVVVSIVGPKLEGGWSASNPMTARQEPLASLNERVRDIVMGPRKGGVE